MAKSSQEIIDELLNKPKSVSSDAGSVTRVSVHDVIAADKHAAKKAAPAGSRLGLRMGVFRAPEHF
jgi:hypothetical protein